MKKVAEKAVENAAKKAGPALATGTENTTSTTTSTPITNSNTTQTSVTNQTVTTSNDTNQTSTTPNNPNLIPVLDGSYNSLIPPVFRQTQESEEKPKNNYNPWELPQDYDKNVKFQEKKMVQQTISQTLNNHNTTFGTKSNTTKPEIPNTSQSSSEISSTSETSTTVPSITKQTSNELTTVNDKTMVIFAANKENNNENNNNSFEQSHNKDQTEKEKTEEEKHAILTTTLIGNFCTNNPADPACITNSSLHKTNDNHDTDLSKNTEISTNKNPNNINNSKENSINPNQQLVNFIAGETITKDSNNSEINTNDNTTQQLSLDNNSTLLKELETIDNLIKYMKEGLNDTTTITKEHKTLLDDLTTIFEADLKKKKEFLQMQKTRNEIEYDRIYPDKSKNPEEIQILIKEFSTENQYNLENCKKQILNRQQLIKFLENNSDKLTDKELIEIGRLSRALSFRDAEFDGINDKNPNFQTIDHYEKHGAGFVIEGELLKGYKGTSTEIEKIYLDAQQTDILKLVKEKEFVGGIVQATDDKFKDMFVPHSLLSHMVMAVQINKIVYFVGFCTSDKSTTNIQLSPNQPFNEDGDNNKPQMFNILTNITAAKLENFTENEEITEYLKSDAVFKILLPAFINKELTIINNPINPLPIITRNDAHTLIIKQLNINCVELEKTKIHMQHDYASDKKKFEIKQKKKEVNYNLMKLTEKYQKTLSKSEKIIYDYYLQLKKKVNIINAEEQSQQNIVNKEKNQSPNKKPPHDIS